VGVALALADMISGGLLVLCLGWLLATGSGTLNKRIALQRLLRGATVADALRRDVPRVGPGLTIDTFADRFEGEDGISALPVMEDDTVLGVIGIKRLQRLGRRKFAATRAADVMAAPPAARFLEPGEDLWTAVELMNRLGYDGLAVVDDGVFAGMVVRESIGELIMARTGDVEPAGARGGRA
jgi:CBS domain-containing protein